MTAAVLALTSLLLGAAPAAADQDPPALFALIIGVNRSADPDLVPLSYADDDAVRYHDLFRSLGARTYLLTRPDENTRRVSPQAVAEAREPTRAELGRALGALAADVAQARARHVRAHFYFVYAGHGNSADGESAYLSLEDARLQGGDLAREVVDRVNADQAHLIVDACYSYLLAFGRGPGGHRREVHGFAGFGELSHRPNVGLLLSTSAARESHEWEDFQAGVFSHEVRSGLYGAADVDGDGRVSYRELGAFIARANAAIPNERFRPEVFARPPQGEPAIVDLRHGLERRLTVDGDAAQAHYLLEDLRGNRLADFHKGQGQTLSLLRPAAAGVLFLRRLSDDREYEIPAAPDVVRVSELQPAPSRALARGAAHHAFSLLFTLPFDAAAVSRYQLPPVALLDEEDRGQGGWRTAGGVAVAAVALAAGVGGVVLLSAARSAGHDAAVERSQARASELNDLVDARNHQAAAAFTLAGGAAATAAFLWLWPDSPAQPVAAITGDGLRLALVRRF